MQMTCTRNASLVVLVKVKIRLVKHSVLNPSINFKSEKRHLKPIELTQSLDSRMNSSETSSQILLPLRSQVVARKNANECTTNQNSTYPNVTLSD